MVDGYWVVYPIMRVILYQIIQDFVVQLALIHTAKMNCTLSYWLLLVSNLHIERSKMDFHLPYMDVYKKSINLKNYPHMHIKNQSFIYIYIHISG